MIVTVRHCWSSLGLLVAFTGACKSESRPYFHPYTGEDDGGDGDGSKNPVLALTTYVGASIWTNLLSTAAVDTANRVFVTDGSNIYMATNDTAYPYATQSVLQTTLGGNTPDILSLDVGPDNKLYILDDSSDAILQSAGPNLAVMYRNIADIPGERAFLGAYSADRHLIVSRDDGLYEATATGNRVLFGESEFGGGTSCPSEDFEVTFDGFLFYNPGCDGSDIVGGALEGGSVEVLAEASEIEDWSCCGFNGIGRDTLNGGVVINAETALIRMESDGHFSEIVTQPTLGDIATQDKTSFHSRAIAVGPTGDIYIISSTTIYKASLE